MKSFYDINIRNIKDISKVSNDINNIINQEKVGHKLTNFLINQT